MAYGRDAQAEEILKDAISKEPKRYELHLKLLEMYAASKNLSAFETIAGELYTTLGAEDPTWAKVAEIGIKLEPNNPLYQAGSSPAGSSNKSADSSDKLDASDFSDSPLAAEKDLDFSFDNEPTAQDFAAPDTATINEIDLDLAKPEADNAVDFSVSQTQADKASDADSGLDFDLGDFNTAELNTAIEEPVQASTEAFAHTMPSLDIPTFDAPQFMPETGAALTDTTSGKTESLPELNEIKLEDFDFPAADTLPKAGVLDISGTDSQGESSDFNFEINTIAPEASDLKNKDASESNAFDLTTISLDSVSYTHLDVYKRQP